MQVALHSISEFKPNFELASIEVKKDDRFLLGIKSLTVVLSI